MTLLGLEQAAEAPGTSDQARPELPSTRARLVSREITLADLPAIAALLHEGFPDRRLDWFQSALACLARLPEIPTMPRFGYLLADHGQPVGAVLSIASQRQDSSEPIIRLNVACWYVSARYRVYGTILYQRLLARRDATFLNVTPAAHTCKVIEAQGFRRFAEGTFAGVPLLGNRPAGVRVCGPGGPAECALPAAERAILAFHAQAGCITFTCATGTQTLPFIFRKRSFRRLPSAAQLIYCRELADLSQCAGAIGVALAQRGLPWIVAGTNGPIGGMAGRYFHGKHPMYYKGEAKPRLGDLAFTELALLAH